MKTANFVDVKPRSQAKAQSKGELDSHLAQAAADAHGDLQVGASVYGRVTSEHAATT